MWVLIVYFRIKEFLRESSRSIKYFFQRVFRGWDDTETWCLQYEFIKWLFPRLKRFKKISIAYPCCYTEQEWDEFLQNLIDKMEVALKGYENLGEMSLDEEEEFLKEIDYLLETIFMHMKLFGW